jgi:CelD/BcsL family acetyltransferase involved in cellulose biosynthesis
MKTTIFKGSRMPSEILAAWDHLRMSNPALASPYFDPAFTQIISMVRDNVEVAAVEKGGEVVAIFPYQRWRYNIGGPVGEMISDYQALICRPGFVIHPQELLRCCELTAWDFNHLLATQTFFCDFYQLETRSPIIDLSAGYDAYVKERSRAGSTLITQCARFSRRLERDVGPLRFVSHLPGADVLEQFIARKSNHLRHRRMSDPFRQPWVRQALLRIHATQTESFGGVLSALYAGDQMIASHFGMRSRTVLHGWFLVYDEACAKNSPGLILWLKLAERAETLGLKAIDLGRGEQAYKHRLMNGEIPLAEGSVELPCLTTAARRVITPVRKLPFKVRCWVSKTPLGAVARRVRERISQ